MCLHRPQNKHTHTEKGKNRGSKLTHDMFITLSFPHPVLCVCFLGLFLEQGEGKNRGPWNASER